MYLLCHFSHCHVSAVTSATVTYLMCHLNHCHVFNMSLQSLLRVCCHFSQSRICCHFSHCHVSAVVLLWGEQRRRNKSGKMWTGFIWLRTGTSGGLLRTHTQLHLVYCFTTAKVPLYLTPLNASSGLCTSQSVVK
jgi:hypothetical protein